MIGLEILVEYFIVFFGMLIGGVAGTAAVLSVTGIGMKIYEQICKTSDALAETRVVTENIMDKLTEKKE